MRSERGPQTTKERQNIDPNSLTITAPKDMQPKSKQEAADAFSIVDENHFTKV